MSKNLNSHYDCDLPHRTAGGGPPKKHFKACRAAEGHDQGSNTMRCRTCQRMYRDRYIAQPANVVKERERGRARIGGLKRKAAASGHYACEIPREDHLLVRFIGDGHRRDCEVAPGHTPGTASGSTCQLCRQTIRRRRQLKSYRLTAQDVEHMTASQNGRCAACEQPPKEGKTLVIDHHHGTGRVRGLLCGPCNLGLGCFGDSPQRLVAARDYLLRTSS